MEGLSLKKFAKLARRVVVSRLADIRFHYYSVCDVLLNLWEEADNSVAALEALSLVQNTEQFEFMITMGT